MLTFAGMYFVNAIFLYNKLRWASVISNDAVNLEFGGAFLKNWLLVIRLCQNFRFYIYSFKDACSVCSKVWCLLIKVALKVKPNLGGRILFLFPKVHSSKDLPSLFGLFWVAVTCSGVCFLCDSWKCKRIPGEKHTNRTASSDAVSSFKSKYLVFPFEATLTGLSRWI